MNTNNDNYIANLMHKFDQEASTVMKIENSGQYPSIVHHQNYLNLIQLKYQ